MEKVLDNEFAFISLLTSVAMLAAGIYFKAFPPQKLNWYNSIPLKSSWQYNKAVQREAMRWTIKPAIIMAGLFMGLAFLSLTFASLPIFSFYSASFLTMACCYALILMRKRHLQRLYEDNGDFKKNH